MRPPLVAERATNRTLRWIGKIRSALSKPTTRVERRSVEQEPAQGPAALIRHQAPGDDEADTPALASELEGALDEELKAVAVPLALRAVDA